MIGAALFLKENSTLHKGEIIDKKALGGSTIATTKPFCPRETLNKK
jgi:hypothetical protein